MATATSRSALAGIVALALALAGCGGGVSAAGGSGSAAGATVRAAGANASAPGASGGRAAVPARQSFPWLRPAPPPAGWTVASIPDGATLPFPPDWKAVHGDAGTATAMRFGVRGQTRGYLNLTPRQGGETLSNWTRFRLRHNSEEGDRSVRRMAAGARLQFRDGRGTCVQDSYITATGGHYTELACLVAGRKSTSVVVGAAPPRAWTQVAPSLERAISGVTA
jgi:hypothetical protein